MKNGEGMGRLTIEDLQAMGEPQQESTLDLLRRMISESDAQITAMEKKNEKVTVLARAAVIASQLTEWSNYSEHNARKVFDILEALDAEYERRYAGRS